MASDKTILLAFGDSVVAGKGDGDSRGWPGRLSVKLDAFENGIAVYNLGINGQTSAGIELRWRQEFSARVRKGQKAVSVFSFGLNDLTRVDGGGPRLPLERSAASARALLEEAQGICTTLWVGPTPVDNTKQPYRSGSGEMLTKRNADVRRYNDAYAALADELAVPYLDLFRSLSGTAGWTAMLADGVHPNATGYDRIAAEVHAWPAFQHAF